MSTVERVVRASSLFAAACLVLARAGSATGSEPLAVWTQPATVRVFQNAPVLPLGAAQVSAARNETEAFQVVVHGGTTGVTGVDAVVSDLVDGAGHVIPASRVTFYREQFVHVDIPSFMGGVLLNPRAVGDYPDALVPFVDPYDPAHPRLGAPFDVAAATAQPLWVDVEVPIDAPSAIYTGTVTVTADGGRSATVPVELTVWDFAIPSERHVDTAYGFGWGGVLDYHGGQDGAWDEHSLAVLRNYENELHRHRVDETDIDQGVPSPFVFGPDGHLLPVDWSAYDATVGPRLDGSYFPDGVPVRRFNAAFFRPGHGGGLEGSLSDAQYSEAAAAYAAHLKEKGWFDRVYVYTKDEPWMDPSTYPLIVADVALMVAGDPDWKGHMMSTMWFDETLAGSIDIWVPNTTVYDDFFVGWIGLRWPGREVYDQRRALGEKLWLYVCNCTWPPYAGYDIDTTFNYEPRILMWGAWMERATGFLYWRTNYWSDDPWSKVIDPEAFPLVARNGDGFLFYPGDHDGTAAPAGSPPGIAIDGPIGTLRLKATRDGMEDWEMFLLATQVAGEDAVRALVSQAYTQLGDFILPPLYDPFHPPWTLDERVVRQVREQIAALIAPPPPPTGGCRVGGPNGDSAAGDGALVVVGWVLAGVRRGWRVRRSADG